MIKRKETREKDCPVCFDGWLDDGWQFPQYVPCPCTGEADIELVIKVCKNYPAMKEFLETKYLENDNGSIRS